MTPSSDYLARLDELVAQTKEEKPRSVRSTISTVTSEGGYWRWNGQEWVPAHRWSTDPAAAAQLMREVVDASPENHYGSGYTDGEYFCIIRAKAKDTGKYVEYEVLDSAFESAARTLCWLRWKGVEVPDATDTK